MIISATPETGLLLVGRVGERVIKTDMTVTKNFLVMVIHQLLFSLERKSFFCRRLSTKALQVQERPASSQGPREPQQRRIYHLFGKDNFQMEDRGRVGFVK